MWIGSPGMGFISTWAGMVMGWKIMDHLQIGVDHGPSTAAVPIIGPWILMVIGEEAHHYQV